MSLCKVFPCIIPNKVASVNTFKDVSINGVRYTYETTDRVPPNGLANETAAEIASALTDLINIIQK